VRCSAAPLRRQDASRLYSYLDTLCGIFCGRLRRSRDILPDSCGSKPFRTSQEQYTQVNAANLTACTPDYRKALLRLQADLDQQIAEAEGLVENANMPVPEWVQANVMLKDLEQTRAVIEVKLRAE
jgi:hypothetical protein